MISSMGYLVFLNFIKKAKRNNSHFHVCNLRGDEQEGLEIMKFDGVETLGVNRQQALRLLNTAVESPGAGS